VPICITQRGADSAFVERIEHVVFDGASGGSTIPDGCWDLVFMRHRGVLKVLQTGVITRPVDLGYESGDEYLCISFKPGVFMPNVTGVTMVDHAILRPVVSARAFALDTESLEIPTFDNAEGAVARMMRKGLLVRDDIVAGVVDESPFAISPRSVQRHFQLTMGLTPKQFSQIRRARQALAMLEQGRAAIDVALDLGFSDQAHLTRSLKTFTGQTPGAILRGR
jgi:hypothetical protein